MVTYLYTNELSTAAIAAVCKCTEADVRDFKALCRAFEAAYATCPVAKSVLSDIYAASIAAYGAYASIAAFLARGFKEPLYWFCREVQGAIDDPNQIEQILRCQPGFFPSDVNAWASLRRGDAYKEVTELHWC